METKTDLEMLIEIAKPILSEAEVRELFPYTNGVWYDFHYVDNTSIFLLAKTDSDGISLELIHTLSEKSFTLNTLTMSEAFHYFKDGSLKINNHPHYVWMEMDWND